MEKVIDIGDVMNCPDCDSFDCYEYSTDELCFDANGKGHYNVDCHCRNCGKDFRLYTEFKYSVTRAYRQ